MPEDTPGLSYLWLSLSILLLVGIVAASLSGRSRWPTPSPRSAVPVYTSAMAMEDDRVDRFDARTIYWVLSASALRECADFAYYVRRGSRTIEGDSIRHVVVTDSPSVAHRYLTDEWPVIVRPGHELPRAELAVSGGRGSWVRIGPELAKSLPDSVFRLIEGIRVPETVEERSSKAR